MTYQFDKSGKLKSPTPQELAEADAQSAILVLDQGVTKDDSPYWAYIAIKPSKYDEFIRMTREHQSIRLADYGVILKYGFDNEVPPSVREDMIQEYGFDDNYLAVIAEETLKEQSAFLKQQESQRINDIVTMLKDKQQE